MMLASSTINRLDGKLAVIIDHLTGINNLLEE